MTQSSAPKTSILAIANGLPGGRYVSRHITYVAALLLHEIWYDGQWGVGPNMAAPLEGFINQTVSACSSAFLYPCSAPYLEFYSPMFYYYDTGNRIPDDPTIIVNPKNTSRTCPKCLNVTKKNRPTRDLFRCIRCGR